jgi:hypothetical protein
MGYRLAVGGELEARRRASRESWRRTVEFLTTNLARDDVSVHAEQRRQKAPVGSAQASS